MASINSFLRSELLSSSDLGGSPETEEGKDDAEITME